MGRVSHPARRLQYSETHWHTHPTLALILLPALTPLLYRLMTSNSCGPHRVPVGPHVDVRSPGVIQVLQDERMKDLLEACIHHHGIPPMLLLRHNERHFYGLKHGSLFVDWNARQGPAMRERVPGY